MRTRPLTDILSKDARGVWTTEGGRVLGLRTMEPNTPHSQSRTGYRPTYILLGIDADGRHHVYRTADETVHVIAGTERQFVLELADDETADDQMQIVADHTGWETRYYGFDAVVDRAEAFA